jgi:hypothetical protein
MIAEPSPATGPVTLHVTVMDSFSTVINDASMRRQAC